MEHRTLCIIEVEEEVQKEKNGRDKEGVNKIKGVDKREKEREDGEEKN